MAPASQVLSPTPATARTGRLVSSVRFDGLGIAVCCWLIGGVFLDTWAHSNLAILDSTRTCSGWGRVKEHAPRGRVYTCAGCGAVLSRDGNGAANICSRATYGQYGQVQVHSLRYRRATAVVPRKRARFPA